MSTTGETLFRNLVEKFKSKTNTEFIEKIWKETMKKIAMMEEGDKNTKKLASAIRDYVEINKDKESVKSNERLYSETEELVNLFFLFILQTDSLGYGYANTKNLLETESFSDVVSGVDYIFSNDTWNKYVVTYKFCQKNTGLYDTSVIKAYFNVFAQANDGGRYFLFADLQNAIFPKEAEYMYVTNYKKRGPDNGDDGGSTQTKTKRRYYRGDEGDDGGSTQTKTEKRYPRGDDGGSSSIETISKTKTNLKL